MGIRLNEVTVNHNNNFTLIRFIAASMVLYSHMFTLLGEKFHPYAKNFGLTLGVVGVDIFFFTSGFLVTASLLTRKDIFAFAWARFLRIYPALLFAVIFSISVGAYFTILPMDNFFAHSLVHKFFLHNTSLIGGITYFLPGDVFSDNIHHGVNGSLWTLPWEVKMYFILLFFGLLTFYKPSLITQRGLVVLSGLIVTVSLVLLFSNYLFHFITSVHIKPALRFLPLFFMGSIIYLLKDKVILSKRLFVLIVISILLSIGNPKLYYVLHYFFIGYIILYIAYIPKGKILFFNKLGDYSYGLYIYAYPVQQSVIALNPGISAINAFYISFAITLLLAVLSWHLLEKRMLGYKNSYFKLKDFVLNKFRKINE